MALEITLFIVGILVVYGLLILLAFKIAKRIGKKSEQLKEKLAKDADARYELERRTDKINEVNTKVLKVLPVVLLICYAFIFLCASVGIVFFVCDLLDGMSLKEILLDGGEYYIFCPVFIVVSILSFVNTIKTIIKKDEDE